MGTLPLGEPDFEIGVWHIRDECLTDQARKYDAGDEGRRVGAPPVTGIPVYWNGRAGQFYHPLHMRHVCLCCRFDIDV